MKPGDFRARCRAESWQSFDVVLAAGQETTTSRWDAKRGEEVFDLRCAFDTTDREAFVEHMVTVHGKRRPSRYRPRKIGQGMWTGPRLADEGQPFKDRSGLTQTCTRCGLVAEVTAALSDQLWWDEHLRMCAVSAEAGAA